MTPTFDTSRLHHLLPRIKAGDPDAENLLFSHARERLEGLAHRMLATFPHVRRWEETGDVLHNAALRLLRALKAPGVSPSSTRSFFNLAAQLIRRELLDLAARYRARYVVWASQRPTPPLSAGSGSFEEGPVAEDRGEPVEELEQWTAFHTEAANLPDRVADVFRLWFYQGLFSPQIAELLDLDERGVRRRLREACVILRERLKGWLPGEEAGPRPSR